MSAFLLFTARRAATALVTLVAVSLIVFSLMELVPGTCAERYLAFKNTQGSAITVEDIRAEERRLGLDRPFLVRWAEWTGNAMTGEFGTSCILRMDVNLLIGPRFAISLLICFAALLFAYAIAIPVGIAAAASDSRWLEGSLRFVSYLGLALPNFLLALIVMVVSTIWFDDSMTGLFSREYRDAPWSVDRVLDFLSRAWLPVFILGWSATAFALQTVRALMLDEIGKPYVEAARARGLSGWRLMWRYPARHALGPVVNSVGFDLNRIFNELPVVALVLTLTEAGALLLEALARSNDQQLAGAIIFLLTATIVALNFATDLLLAALDPRVRRSVLARA